MMNQYSFNWRTLFFEVSVDKANSIIREQKILPSQNMNNQLFGPGTYFSSTINGAHNISNCHGCYLSADVMMNKTKGIDKKVAEKANKDYWQQLRNEGFDSVLIFSKDASDTFIIFNQDHIKNIRFILFGDNNIHQQPLEENWNLNDILKSRENSITLFYATNLENARSIESSQYIPFESGAFGEGLYLFNTIEDALKHNPNGNTYLSVSANMHNYYQLHSQKDIKQQKVPENKSSFYYEFMSNRTFFFTDPDLISNIHICGNSQMQKHNYDQNAKEIYHPKQTEYKNVPHPYSKENKYVPHFMLPNKKYNSISISKENHDSHLESEGKKQGNSRNHKHETHFSSPNEEYDAFSLNGNHLNRHYNYWNLS